jgi:predicted secreted acid phosphatase
MNTGIYEKICDKGIELCNTTINGPKNDYVAFFDIDGTLINNDSHNIIPSVYNLYKYAQKCGITIAIITARRGDKKNFILTINQLESLGINNYDFLFVRPPYLENLHTYKMFARKYVVEMGYKPLFTIGDMDFDMGLYGGTELLLG